MSLQRLTSEPGTNGVWRARGGWLRFAVAFTSALVCAPLAGRATPPPTATPTPTVLPQVRVPSPPQSGASTFGSPAAVAAPGLATVNLALGELATQSSTAVGGVASRAVDGNTNGSWAGGSVTHTQAQASAWWEVDLGEVREIDDVALWNRTDCCGERLSNFYVMVGSLPGPAPGAPGVFTHFQAAQAGSPTTVAVNRLGRYVRIQKAGSGVIALAEVQVLGRAVTGPLNLALGRPTSQSSTAAGGVSSRAVDGDSDGAYASASVTHTGGGVGSWWEVDLGAPRQIVTIDIWNRTDCCADRLSNYTVLVSFHPGPEPGDPNVFEHFESAQAGRPTTIPVGQLGRYVRIQKSGPGVVALAEVEVFGGDAAVANAALGRAASQSSTAAGGVASRAVDGQVDGAWGAGSVTHTFVNTPAWWEVDLGGAVAVEWVDIWNRTDCCGDRLSQYHVLLSNDPAPQPGDPGIFEHFESAQADSPTTVLVGQSGRYLRVQKASGVVSLAEVQVWASTGSAAYVGQEISPVLTTAESFRASIRLRNTSAVAWSAAGGFALASQSPPDNATWGVSEIAFAPAESVAPGTEKTFTFDIVAPNQSGDYVFQWQLRRDDQWIGEPSPPVTVAVVAPPSASPYSLRFRGNGSQDIDRVKIRLDDPSDSNDTGPPADVGSDDFTLEFWMKASAADNTAPAQTCGDNINWINGNIIIDRDRFNQGRKFGVSIAGGVIIFGVTGDGSGGGANDRTICGTTSVVDDEWHHVAAQRRRSDGQLSLYVDGQLEADADGPDGDVSYPDDGVPCANCCGGSSCDFSDPFLVVGAEKHDADNSNHPSFDGFFDEMRLSDELRYASPFTPPTGPFTPDTGTVALYHFDEGNGDLIVDASGAASGPSPGELRFGGAPAGPLWSIDTPFPAAPTVTFAAVVTAPSRVVAMANAGDHRLFLVTQAGQILIFDGAQILATPFLDIDPLVAPGEGERGLLGLAFHPEYTANGYFYVNYTNNSGNTVVARYRRSTADPDLADPASAVTLLTVAQPAANHNGGQLKFGADGYLYIGLGDGGSGGDPSCFAQRGDTLLGKMLRVDVDQNTAVPPYYGIPPGNPFSGPGDPADEVWALGLRNPWRFTFDRLTGGLFIADVGQHAIEEVSFQAASSSGGENYGWKVMEGTGCYIVDCPGGAPNCNTNNCPGAMPACNHPSLVLPILEYSHALGCSITGGYVYRGRTDGELAGTYLYADFCSRRIWGGRNDGGAWTAPQLATAASNIFTFGQDAAGEMYVSTGTVILRIE